MTQPVPNGARSACFEPQAVETPCADDDWTPLQCPTPTRGLSVGLREGVLETAPSPPSGWASTFHERGLRFCREADSVVEGFLCDERVVVSDACRQPTSALDAYVCDEPRMRALQKSVIRETWSIVKALLLAWLRR
jgi:hypothetical protein